MSNIYYLLDSNVESSSSLITILSYLSIVFAILVITSRNPIISLLYLIALFVDIAIYLISLNLTYLGLSYISIYVGAIAMLFIFVIMMMKIVETYDSNHFRKSIPLSIIIGLLYIYPLYEIIPTELRYKYNYLNIYELGKQMDKINLPSWDNKLFNPSTIENLGTVFYTNYSIWLLIISIILILSIIGAICIAIPKQLN